MRWASADMGEKPLSYENPHDLLARLRLGREEFCQRLLTSLILGGPYPPWNSRGIPTASGMQFMQQLDAVSFGEARWTDGGVFVDELDLPRRSDDERGGAPDQAMLWPNRVWLIELKTEAASHRRDQLPSYYELAAHHYPGVPVDITYLTPPMTTPGPTVNPPNRYAHVVWEAAAALIAGIWVDPPSAGESVVRDVLLETIANLKMSPRQWREGSHLVPSVTAPAQAGTSLDDQAETVADEPDPAHDLLPMAWQLASLTAADGAQRGLDAEVGSLEVLQSLRLEVRRQLARQPLGSPLRHVMPWLWSADTSGGTAITSSGKTTSYELRFSRYGRPTC